MGSESIKYYRIASDSGTRLPDHRQHPWFGIVISVSTSPQVHFLREGVGFICGSELEDAVRRCERDLLPSFWIHALKCQPDTTATVDLEIDAHQQTSL